MYQVLPFAPWEADGCIARSLADALATAPFQAAIQCDREQRSEKHRPLYGGPKPLGERVMQALFAIVVAWRDGQNLVARIPNGSDANWREFARGDNVKVHWAADDARILVE